jgi:hypothetical protein
VSGTITSTGGISGPISSNLPVNFNGGLNLTGGSLVIPPSVSNSVTVTPAATPGTSVGNLSGKFYVLAAGAAANNFIDLGANVATGAVVGQIIIVRNTSVTDALQVTYASWIPLSAAGASAITIAANCSLMFVNIGP